MRLATKRTRNTIQRKAVQEAIHSLAGQHPTASEVYAAVRERYPQLSLATVYRALHALVEQHAVTEMRVENVARYDIGMGSALSPIACPHHHIVCRRCGRVTDVCASAIPSPLLQAIGEAANGFQVDAHPIQFRGVCASCQVVPLS
ncbi:MAG: transcriptional repressor [Cytophagales bacterium]|nr:transcriptional repressor [Armatimonadota bacterium]